MNIATIYKCQLFKTVREEGRTEHFYPIGRPNKRWRAQSEFLFSNFSSSSPLQIPFVFLFHIFVSFYHSTFPIFARACRLITVCRKWNRSRQHGNSPFRNLGPTAPSNAHAGNFQGKNDNFGTSYLSNVTTYPNIEHTSFHNFSRAF